MRDGRRKWRSHIRFVDVAGESWLELTRRPGRTVMTGLGISLSAAAVVATLTLVSTIRYQVSDQFDAQRATQVELRARIDGGRLAAIDDFPPSPSTLSRLEELSGVEGVAVVRETRSEHEISVNQVSDPTVTPTRIKVYAIDTEGFESLGMRLTGPGWDQWHDENGEPIVVLSPEAASRIGIPDVQIGDRVFIQGTGYTVAGILEESARLPVLNTGVVVPLSAISRFEVDTDRDRIIAVTAPGAARQVAAALPVAVTPNQTEAWTAYAPEDDATLRLAVDDQLQALALGLGGIVLILGIITIGNATLTSVMQRIHEIGLRRALGARPRHIAAHVLLDAGNIGLLGGIIGTALGLAATLTITAIQGWIPVIDLRIAIATIAGGLAAGTLAGVYPARVGSRLQPTEALRRD